eukprot:TRINITY_DN14600_c0_g1_i1.p1 TRINITY_DN14600_c0_g1~~TRINITY_DN14600_c0_g1_i1.p1  ORF type:complete len:889 (+),score=364.37 TRINITY_DN14600_c0_g1_i1:86-2752(+)
MRSLGSIDESVTSAIDRILLLVSGDRDGSAGDLRSLKAQVGQLRAAASVAEVKSDIAAARRDKLQARLRGCDAILDLMLAEMQGSAAPASVSVPASLESAWQPSPESAPTSPPGTPGMVPLSLDGRPNPRMRRRATCDEWTQTEETEERGKRRRVVSPSPPPSPKAGAVPPMPPGGGSPVGRAMPPPPAPMLPAEFQPSSSFDIQLLPSDGTFIGEREMVYIAAHLVHELLRTAARPASGGTCYLSIVDLFVDVSPEGGAVSANQLLSWINNTLNIKIAEWHLLDFGRKLKWPEMCQAHPQGLIDRETFCRMMTKVWEFVKFYFTDVVLYGAPCRVEGHYCGITRDPAVVSVMDDLRPIMEGLIRCLVVRMCNVQTFFRNFDRDHSQTLGEAELKAIFWELRGELDQCVLTEEHAHRAAMSCEWLCRKLYRPSGRAREISLIELQELIRDFFTDFTTRLELNVLSCEDRVRLLCRRLVFGVSGVAEVAAQLQPPKNVFDLFAKYCDENTMLRPGNLRQLLFHEFRVALTDQETRLLLAANDTNQDCQLDLTEFTALLQQMHGSVAEEVRGRLPTEFAPQLLAGFNLPSEVLLVLSKMILKLLQTKETFEEFFDSLPSFRPEVFQGFAGKQHYPDEMVVGLRRIGVDAQAQYFDTPSIAGSSLPAQSVLEQSGFLQTVWAVWERYLVPSFQAGLDWGTRAGQAAGVCLACIRLGDPAPSQGYPDIDHAWAVLANKGGVNADSIGEGDFLSTLKALRAVGRTKLAEGIAVWPSWAMPDVEQWRRLAMLVPPPRVCDEVPRHGDTREREEESEALFTVLVGMLFRQADISRDHNIQRPEFQAMYTTWRAAAERAEQTHMAREQRVSVVHYQMQAAQPALAAITLRTNPFAR